MTLKGHGMAMSLFLDATPHLLVHRGRPQTPGPCRYPDDPERSPKRLQRPRQGVRGNEQPACQGRIFMENTAM